MHKEDNDTQCIRLGKICEDDVQNAISCSKANELLFGTGNALQNENDHPPMRKEDHDAIIFEQ